MTIIKLWKWLLTFSKKKYKEAHLDKYHNDIKCPCCNEWMSISGINYKHEEITTPDWGYHIKCGQCGGESYWNSVAFPFLALAKSNGDPI